MNFVRKGAVVSLTSLFTLLLFTIAFSVGILHTVGNPKGVEKVLADSGVYNNLVPNALAQIKQYSTDAGSIPLSNPQIQAAANAALTPAEVQKDVNRIVDSTYDWLNGKTAQPNFSLDLSGVQVTFAQKAADVVKQQAASLPVCTSVDQVNNDVFSATCLPPGVSPDQVAEQAKSQIQSGQGLLGNTTLSADTIKNGNGQNVFNQQIPKTYHKIKTAPLVAIVLAILTAAGIIFLSSTKTKGVRRVAYVLVAIGVLMMVLAYALNRVTDSKILPTIKINNAVSQKQIRTVVRDLEQAIDKNYWTFGVSYAVLGAGAWATTEFIKRRPATASAQNLDAAVETTKKSVGSKPRS